MMRVCEILNILTNPSKIYIFRISSARSTKLCENLRKLILVSKKFYVTTNGFTVTSADLL